MENKFLVLKGSIKKVSNVWNLLGYVFHGRTLGSITADEFNRAMRAISELDELRRGSLCK